MDVVTDVLGSGDGVIVGVFGDGVRRYLTEDGRTFEELSRVPDTTDRRRSDIGWVALDHSYWSQLWVSDDGDEWELIATHGLHDIGMSSSGAPVGTLHLDGSRIYLVVTSPADSDRRTLLIGEVTPHP